ncbi:MAG: sigma-70 family RNA polymerase sigma factor [Planctomycetia bacterium]|nr:sigma-70 family RNA polymerase sigma factor [Planctomycetia bacterium]
MRANDERRRAKRRKPEFLAARCKFLRESHGGCDDPVAVAQANERRDIVSSVIECLPTRRKQIATLHWLEGLDAKEIAERESKPVQTVYSQLRALKSKLEANSLLRSIATEN